MVDEKITGNELVEQVVYQDKIVKIVLPKSASVQGHLQVKPQKNLSKISEFSKEEAEHFFYTCSYTATLLFELMKAEGTNIIVNESKGVVADVVARKSDDVLDFTWQPLTIDEGEMNSALNSIKDNAFYVNNKDAKYFKQEEEPREGKITNNKDESNYEQLQKEKRKEARKEESGMKKGTSEEEEENTSLKKAKKQEDYLIRQLIRIP